MQKRNKYSCFVRFRFTNFQKLWIFCFIIITVWTSKEILYKYKTDELINYVKRLVFFAVRLIEYDTVQRIYLWLKQYTNNIFSITIFLFYYYRSWSNFVCVQE